MEGKIIFEGKTKQGENYVIRCIQSGDAEMMCNYINELSKEQTFISFQGEQVTLENESKYLESQLKRVKNRTSVHLIIVANNKSIGISSIDLKDRTSSHEGVFGISISEEYRGQGIGKILMQAVIDETEKNLSNMKIITLGVFANNPHAIKMYEEFGFKEYGRLPKGFLRKGNYEDHVYMYKKVRD